MTKLEQIDLIFQLILFWDLETPWPGLSKKIGVPRSTPILALLSHYLGKENMRTLVRPQIQSWTLFDMLLLQKLTHLWNAIHQHCHDHHNHNQD